MNNRDELSSCYDNSLYNALVFYVKRIVWIIGNQCGEGKVWGVGVMPTHSPHMGPTTENPKESIVLSSRIKGWYDIYDLQYRDAYCGLIFDKRTLIIIGLQWDFTVVDGGVT
jgi:hypothetical protein